MKLNFRRIFAFIITIAMIVPLVPTFTINVGATTVSVLDGKVSVTDTANSNTVSGGTVTIKAAGNLFGSTTNNITIKNESTETATLSFSFSLTGKNGGYTLPNGATSGSFSDFLHLKTRIRCKLKARAA